MAEQQASEAERMRWVVLDDGLVERRSLTALTGFIRSQADVTDGKVTLARGVILELAAHRDPDRPIPAQLAMRPGLWQGTGTRVFLENYRYGGEMDDLVRLYCREQERQVKGMRTFVVGRAPTDDELQQLPRRGLNAAGR